MIVSIKCVIFLLDSLHTCSTYVCVSATSGWSRVARLPFAQTPPSQKKCISVCISACKILCAKCTIGNPPCAVLCMQYVSRIGCRHVQLIPEAGGMHTVA